MSNLTKNGLETDENGNIIGFSPEKFVAGFLGGAGVSKATQFALKNPKIRAKADIFLKQSGEFIVNELKNPNLPAQTRQTLERIFGKALVRQMDTRAFIIAGENAIGANKAKLSKAQVMQKEGKSDDEIWLKTGWYYDKDGKWKFEINPAGAEFKQDFDKISHIEYNSEGVGYEIRFNGVLSDYLDDKELFSAYPQLKEFKIVVGDIGNPQWLAEYNSKNKIFYLNTNAISKENAKSVLYHEIQHAVQDIENFARGGNPKTALSYADETQKSKVANYKKSFAGKDLNDNQAAYKLLHGEVEARNVENRMKNIDDLKMLDDTEKAAWFEPDEIKNIHNRTKMHPHKTQDIDIKDTILSTDESVSYSVDKGKLKNFDIIPAKKQGEKMDLSEFLDDKGAVDYKKLEILAMNLPSKLSYKGFLKQFENTNKVIIKTPIKDLEVNPKYMFFHLTKYGDKQSKIKGNGKENRLWLNGGVLETLQNPLFITQDKAKTMYFYKAFKNDKGLINLISVAVPKNNSQMIYKTSYDGTNKRILDLIKKYKLIYKAS